MKCRDARAYWELYYDSEGEAARYQQINEHLEHCSSCTEWYSRQREFEEGVSEKLRAPGPTNELWGRIHGSLEVEPPMRRRQRVGFGAMFVPIVALVASVFIAVIGWHFMQRPDVTGPDVRGLDLSQLASVWHDRFVTGQQMLQFESTSDLEIEAYLKDRVSFPVRCPPRQDAGFDVWGGGVCAMGNAPAAYVHGVVGSDRVSIFILPVERLVEFTRKQGASPESRIHHYHHGALDLVVSAVDQNLVIVVGQGSPQRLETVIRTYGSYPDNHSHDAA